MYMNLKCLSFLAVVLYTLSFNAPPVYGQYDSLVKKASIETVDSIRLSCWINDQTIKQNQNTEINFSIENHSSQTIYLVWKQGKLYIDIDCDWRLRVYPSHRERDIGHDETEFNFVKIGKDKVYRGVLIIPISAYDESRVFSIDVSFGYVTDISGLKRQFGEDPARFNGLLDSRIKYFGLGGLVVDVEK